MVGVFRKKIATIRPVPCQNLFQNSNSIICDRRVRKKTEENVKQVEGSGEHFSKQKAEKKTKKKGNELRAELVRSTNAPSRCGGANTPPPPPPIENAPRRLLAPPQIEKAVVGRSRGACVGVCVSYLAMFLFFFGKTRQGGRVGHSAQSVPSSEPITKQTNQTW